MKKSRLALVVAAALLAAACQGVNTAGNVDGLTGIYYLVRVDGSEVPGPVSHDGTMMTIRSGVFIISADGTCFSRTRFVPPGGEEMIREVRATYRAEGPRLTLQWEGAGVTEGAVEGKTFVMDNHGMIFEYERSH